MTDALLMVIVVGVVVIALAVDLGVLVGWLLASRWRFGGYDRREP